MAGSALAGSAVTFFAALLDAAGLVPGEAAAASPVRSTTSDKPLPLNFKLATSAA